MKKKLDFGEIEIQPKWRIRLDGKKYTVYIDLKELGKLMDSFIDFLKTVELIDSDSR